MKRDFYLQFLDTCSQDQENLEILQTLIEKHLKSPVELMIRVKGNSGEQGLTPGTGLTWEAPGVKIS